MQENFLEISEVSKEYGIVQALQNVSFGIRKGEVHTLLGENGAGKSTLIKIISGEESPSSGQIILDGVPISHYNPKTAMSLGIAMVHQELAIFENMSVAENIFPDCQFKTKAGFVDFKRLYEEASARIAMFGMMVEPSQKMDSLTLAQQQMVEILRCIGAGQKVILLDEPTSGLNSEETKRLMEIIGMLKERGITVIYISHRISEILDISDRITVMRDGTYVGTYCNDGTLSENDLIGKMVGRELSGSLYAARTDGDALVGNVVLEVRNVSKKNSVQSAGFSLKKGEVLGFFGLEGSGTNALSRMIYGLESADTIDVEFNGKPMRVSPDEMVRHGIMYLNNNRKNAGLLLHSPASDNISMTILNEISHGIFLNQDKANEYTKKFIREFNIVIPSVYQLPKNLSGGNQQKLMFAICLACNPKILIVNEPTRGIDVGAKSEIHKLMLQLIKQGMSIIVFSSELPELISLADRIIVMHENKISGELHKGEITENLVMTAAAGR